jgi:hypothetical protein
MPKKNFRKSIVIAAAAFGALSVQGCAAGNGAPFHMYDSPLLAGDVESRYPRSRSFDPIELGDHNPPTTYYAQNDASGASKAGTRTAPAATPALATQAHAAQSQKGAPAEAIESARPSTKHADAADLADTSQPALAADYVWSVYGLNGVHFPAAARRSVPKLFRACKERGRVYHSSVPAIGDVVFFHNTADVNGDGRNNDWYTHAAIVEAHGRGGTVSLLGYRAGEVRRFRMDLGSPDAAMGRHGEVVNSRLRAPTDQDAPFTQYLAGQLFAGTCAALGDRAQFVIVDNWEPGMELSR